MAKSPAEIPRPEKIFPVSWDQFHRDSRALAWRLHEAGPFEAIVCITRGRAGAAAIVAAEQRAHDRDRVCRQLSRLHEPGRSVGSQRGRAGSGCAPFTGKARVWSWMTLSILERPRVSSAISCRTLTLQPSMRSRWGGACRHVHHRGVAGHLDLFPLGYGPGVPAADPREGGD